VGQRSIRSNLQKGIGAMPAGSRCVDREDRGFKADSIGFLDSDMETR
jgi:hypothetical protein